MATAQATTLAHGIADCELLFTIEDKVAKSKLAGALLGSAARFEEGTAKDAKSAKEYRERRPRMTRIFAD